MITLLLAITVTPGPATLVLKGLDPINLALGVEVPGKPELSAVYGRHEYRFWSAENLAEFKRSPVEHAVQTGGACGKMGALTGKGAPDRWAVVGGKVFLFASEGCRTTFLANRAKYFAPIAEVPPASTMERQDAADLYQKMIEAHGGQRAIGFTGTVVWTVDTPYVQGGKNLIWHTRNAIVNPSKFANWEEWDTGRAYFAADSGRAVDGKPGENYIVHPAEMRELKARIARSPFGILKGAGGTPIRPTADGLGFSMARGDVVFDVILDSVTGRISQIRYLDRHAGPVSSVVVEYSAYERLKGIWIPRASRTNVDAKGWSKLQKIDSVHLNAAMPSVFADAFGM